MNFVHLHLALNHVPVLGVPFLLFFLLWSFLRGQAVTLRFCLWLFVALTVVSIGIKFTGDLAVADLGGASGLDAAVVERHEQAADQATTGVFFMGLVAVVALVRARGGRPVRRPDVVVLALLALGTFLLLARTANLGGQLRHPEVTGGASRAKAPEAVAPASGAGGGVPVPAPAGNTR